MVILSALTMYTVEWLGRCLWPRKLKSHQHNYPTHDFELVSITGFGIVPLLLVGVKFKIYSDYKF